MAGYLSRSETGCSQVRKLSSAYLENGLSPGQQSKVQVHLTRCAPCRAFIDSLAATIKMLGRLPSVRRPSRPRGPFAGD